MTRCKNCNAQINALEYLIDIRHQLGWCVTKPTGGGEEE